MSEDVQQMKEAAERTRQQQLLQQQQMREQQRQAQAAAAAARPKPEPPQPTTGAERTINRLQNQASQTRTRIEQGLQGRMAQAVPTQVFKETATVAQATRSISAAETAIQQAEALTESWGSTIQWGDATYDLGTTQGYKDYKQAVREAKSDINKAKNTLKRYENAKWEERTSKKAKEAVDKANKVIEDANKIISQQNVNIEKIAEANKKLIEAKFTHDVKPMSKDEYRAQQIKDTYGYLTAFIMEDIADEKKVSKTIAQVAPLYISQGQGESEFGKWMDKIEELKRDAEARAEWKANEGKNYKDRMKPENRPTLQQIGARLEHLGLSAGQATIYAAPIAAATALGGPLASGIVIAGTVATFANPKTRYETALFIGEHPEEFFAGIAGALAAGMAVSKAGQIWGKYKAQLKTSEIKKLQAQYDKMIDDYTYLEQQKGQQFPTRVAETPEGAYLQTLPPGSDAWEQYVFKKFLTGAKPEDVAEWLKTQKPALMLELNGAMEPTFVDEIISKYPELRDPFISPAFADPNILAKSDLVARVTGTGMAMTPLLTAALAIVAKQGYITENQIKQLIKNNTQLLEAYKAQGIQLTTPWTLQDLKNLSLTDAATAVSVVPVQLADTIALQDTIQAQIQIVEEVPVQEVEPIPTEPTPTKPTPTEEPPRGAGGRFISRSKELKRDMSLIRFYQGKKANFKVVISYPHGSPERLKVEASSYPQAMQIAMRQRTPRRDIPSEVNLWQI